MCLMIQRRLYRRSRRHMIKSPSDSSRSGRRSSTYRCRTGNDGGILATIRIELSRLSRQPPIDHGGAKDGALRRRFRDERSNPEATALTENGAAQKHTLYQTSPAAAAGDEDVIPFSVTAGGKYTLETVNLTNGADTYLFITDSPNSSTPLSGLQNDNRSGRNHQNCGANPFTGNSTCPDNDQTTLSSSINWTASNTTTLYAHVQRSPNAPPSAGILGSYDIRLKKE